MFIFRVLRRMASDERGTETLEWGLVCGLIVIGSIVAITAVGPKVKTLWDNINASLK